MALNAGDVVGFFENDSYQHSMVVCEKGELAGVNNLNVGKPEVLEKKECGTGYCQLEVENLNWKNDDVLQSGYMAYAMEARAIATRIKNALDSYENFSQSARSFPKFWAKSWAK